VDKTLPFAMTFSDTTPVSRSTSFRISIARVLCIILVTFVHVQPGIAENVYTLPVDAFGLVYFLLTRVIGLSSVSLLGIVSGFLIAGSLAKGHLSTVTGKVRSLIVPLIAWNAVMFVLIIIYAQLSGNWDKLPEASPLGIANAFLALQEWPLVVPLWFLRDLFVCCLLSPLLVFALYRAPTAAFAVLIGYMLFGQDTWLLQRPQLLLFFAIGLWLRIGAFQDGQVDRATKCLALGLAPMAAVFFFIRIDGIPLHSLNPQVLAGLDTLLRITMAAAIWQVTLLIAGSSKWSRIKRFEPYVFVLFCSHAIVFEFAGIPLRRVFGNYGDPLFSVSFFLQPVIAIAAAWIGVRVLMRLPSVIGKALNGGKLVLPH
jgi:fucose 4-O-acetylase-like acetyltransferase